jgi:hypothetical protein
MPANASRYPGVQPFTDNSLARSTFFGRQHESDLLKAQVISSRLTVVYARSGIGKTSLLNAGLHQALRDDGFLPLMVRFNDHHKSVVDCILDPMADLAKRQSAEIVEGSRRSLWHYFKTVEFWNEDILLKPVLILDQFEELFTLRDLSDQANLLQELGHLVRGDAPCGEGEQLSDSLLALDRQQELTMTAPTIHVILSLREDFLGLLDEASDYMPSILSNRFRLRPLSMAAAYEALSAPSQLSNAAFASRKFTIDVLLQNDILSFISDEAPKIAVRVEQIEPFQLQLICQQIEEHVIRRQRQDPSYHLVTLQDIGGRKALKKGMRNFYARVVSHCCDDIGSYVGIFRRSLIKKRVRNLCSKQLISPDGRRLSIDEDSLLSRFRIPRQVLASLVQARLLRSDQRSGNTYYELSHDTLADEIRHKPLTINIRVQQLLLLLAEVVLAALLIPLMLCLAFSVTGVLNPSWAIATWFNTVLNTSLGKTEYFFTIFVLVLSVVSIYQVLLLCLRGTKHLNRLLEPRAQRLEMLQLKSFKPEPDPFSLVIDAALQTVSLLKDWRILAFLGLIWLPLNILQVRASLLDAQVVGYSDIKHPIVFVLWNGAILLSYAIVAYVMQHRLSQSVRPAQPYPFLNTVTMATLKTYPLTGLWSMLWILFAFNDNQFNENIWTITKWVLFSILCLSSYRYLYLGYHYALNPIPFNSALYATPRLLNYNRWTVLIACTLIIFIGFFVSITRVILSIDASSPYAGLFSFVSYLMSSITWLWLYSAIFLGYIEARENHSI